LIKSTWSTDTALAMHLFLENLTILEQYRAWFRPHQFHSICNFDGYLAIFPFDLHSMK
jgi:hypothetical protein